LKIIDAGLQLVQTVSQIFRGSLIAGIPAQFGIQIILKIVELDGQLAQNAAHFALVDLRALRVCLRQRREKY
jgi:hypothetical protein